ncbi:transglutaminase-like cysteine peptidase [Pleomorphomonas diazotrophica]|uniref:transglutaminase-like cysteine peptidase n=1 Tax=Pleomorphomonas diazotrophica TaxID=1166257 RepID=UPI0015D64AE3|nr:transglutaminase-like cysteine peptidase [Pleomorphomonas diazotrophica]
MSSVLALLIGFYAASTLGPTGFYEMCTTQQVECLPVVQTRGLSFTEIEGINRRVNRDIRSIVEPPGVDVWRIGPREGDCDDYVMTKRQKLIKAGLGSDRARVAVGMARGQLHAVLVVNFGPYFYVLDNLTDEVLPVEKSAVRIVSVQSAADPRMWHKAPGEDAGNGRAVAAARDLLRPPR